MKTYKQLAEELGVPKDKIKYRAREIPREERPIIDGTTYLSEKAEALIKSAILGSNLDRVVKGVSTTALLPILLEMLENQRRIIELLEQGNHPVKPEEKKSLFSRLLG